jgi:hypothetical protein
VKTKDLPAEWAETGEATTLSAPIRFRPDDSHWPVYLASASLTARRFWSLRSPGSGEPPGSSPGNPHGGRRVSELIMAQAGFDRNSVMNLIWRSI